MNYSFPRIVQARVRLKSDDYIYIFFSLSDEKKTDQKVRKRVVLRVQIATLTSSHRLVGRNNGVLRFPIIPPAMLLETMGDDQVQLLISPGCGFRLIHDPEMGKITVTDDHDYRRLLPSAASIE